MKLIFFYSLKGRIVHFGCKDTGSIPVKPLNKLLTN